MSFLNPVDFLDYDSNGLDADDFDALDDDMDNLDVDDLDDGDFDDDVDNSDVDDLDTDDLDTDDWDATDDCWDNNTDNDDGGDSLDDSDNNDIDNNDIDDDDDIDDDINDNDDDNDDDDPDEIEVNDTDWSDENVVAQDDAGIYDNFDSTQADMDMVVGNPTDNMENWHVQETDSSCAVCSQEFVLEELTGIDFNEADLRDFAEANGWYDPEGGTAIDDVGNILEAAGLHVNRSGGNSIDDIEQCLQNDGGVIVALDSDEIWFGEDDDLFFPGMDADHAVQVIGIDRSNPDSPMVILNDSGAPDGAGAMVPLDLFEQAWEDSGCFMVEAYA